MRLDAITACYMYALTEKSEKEQDASGSTSDLTADAGVYRDKTMGCSLARRWAQQRLRRHGEQAGEEAPHVRTGSSDGSRAHEG